MGILIVLAGAAAGWMGALAIREAIGAAPGAGSWLAGALEPLRRAGREGYTPTAEERRRLVLVGTLGLAAVAAWLLGPLPAPLVAVAGPALVTGVIARRRARYRRAVERAVPQIATSLADAIAAGRSVRAALWGLATALEGPAAVEVARLRTELDLGMSVAEALDALRGRVSSPRIDALAAALVTQGLAGGDLAGLLRRFARASAERERAAADARAATAQARFTGLLVVAMPTGAALFAELLESGFIAGLLSSGPATAVLIAAAALQLIGFASIRRLGRVVVD